MQQAATSMIPQMHHHNLECKKYFRTRRYTVKLITELMQRTTTPDSVDAASITNKFIPGLVDSFQK